MKSSQIGAFCFIGDGYCGADSLQSSLWKAEFSEICTQSKANLMGRVSDKRGICL